MADLPNNYKKFQNSKIKAVMHKDLLSQNNWLEEVEQLFNSGIFLKKGNTAQVVKAQNNNHNILIKKYKYKNTLHSLRQAPRKKRAERCWSAGLKLQEIGICTPTPLGYISKYRYGLFAGAYLLTEFVENEYLHKYFENSTRTKEQLQQTAKLVTDIFTILEQNYIVHGDLKCSNILIHNHKPVIIDLDSIKLYNKLSYQRRKTKDRNRFHRELQKFPHLQIFFAVS
ncbi:lipopolysaccharide kinase InaA family protein [Candidatus Uabimicrobium sp. HlEnr_7]|uniref:lipopolysaccharide kinase InaA family protein n=1 Tax=Candidatus Uabimicrobium helgolandensis TaxID=3095367 RepID=UPI0035561F0A